VSASQPPSGAQTAADALSSGTLYVHDDNTMHVTVEAWNTAFRALRSLPPSGDALPTDGLAALITTILRKYGGTMKGRGDHDIYEALVRYRAALATTLPQRGSLSATYVANVALRAENDRLRAALATPAPLDVERLARALAMWSPDTSEDFAHRSAVWLARAYAEQEGGA